jgi:hypothetical protein
MVAIATWRHSDLTDEREVISVLQRGKMKVSNGHVGATTEISKSNEPVNVLEANRSVKSIIY